MTSIPSWQQRNQMQSQRDANAKKLGATKWQNFDKNTGVYTYTSSHGNIYLNSNGSKAKLQ